MKKVTKYKDMAANMLVKEKEAEVKGKKSTVISKFGFGFPERPNVTLPNMSSVKEPSKLKVANRRSLP